MRPLAASVVASFLVLAIVTPALSTAEALRPADAERSSYLAHVAAASASLRLAETAEARRWLEGAPSAHRGWEWRHLALAADHSEAAFRPEPGPPWRLAWSPNGALLAGGARKDLVPLCDPVTGKVVSRPLGHCGNVLAVAFAPDGRVLNSGSADTTVRLWDVVDGTVTLILSGFSDPVNTVGFSPDGDSLAVTSSGAELVLLGTVTDRGGDGQGAVVDPGSTTAGRGTTR
jgi:streptogramin lyase